MRYARDHKAKTRSRILSVATKNFKEHGFHGINIADLMKAVGLTHGGFYAHFKSKEQLAIESCQEGFRHSARRMKERIGALEAKRSAPPLQNLLEAYLCPEHVAHPSEGCPIPSFSTDLSRDSSKRLKVAYEKELKTYSEILRQYLGQDRWTLESTLSLMGAVAGVLMMVRSLDDSDLAEKILQTAREDILHRFSNKEDSL